MPFNMVLALASVFIVFGGLKLGSDLIIPILLSLFFAILCSQPVRWLKGRGWNVILAVTVVLVMALLMLGLISLLIGSQFTQFSEQWPRFSDRLSELYNQGVGILEGWGLPIDQQAIVDKFDPSQMMHYVPGLLSSVGDTLSQAVIILVMAVFMIFEIIDLPTKLRAAFTHADGRIERVTQFSESLTRYLIVKSEIGLICAVATTVACWILGVQFALIWGVLAFLLNFIPNIGAFLSAIPPVIMALVMPEVGVMSAIILAVVLGLVHFISGNVFEPHLMGQALGISSLMVFLSLVVWGWVFGPVGLLLSVPLTMSLKILLDCHPDTRWLSVLIGPVEQEKKAKRAKKVYESR
ncbi:AI-2E family transporter [Carnimonas nigrificans]|uniref:AI-2E family transporter n=1 Tax=Carnimonas nigrificans TaxID=64323 RepID=UPI000472E96A|nr:AI-2E family transporter [Carnimonas nigrificans]